ncbi:MAG: hypothetical protein LBE92_06125 [Chryseobacterium sp.]|uniref:hypothetical protein n=1 Tax=Chryseobacterium sp. TaxID=1871047 RepID=UPI00282E395D|nr:hypothetical protein [Chryseobacterium sp.]MDR2235680.1 hypothetical protein [Chryseobacterium sp.]
MEEVRLLHEVMAELLDNGYVTDFGMMKYIFPLMSAGPEKKAVSGSEFTIDEIYRCHETEYDSEIIYIFAISSTRYNIKGITTSISPEQHSLNFSEVAKKIWEAGKRLLR